MLAVSLEFLVLAGVIVAAGTYLAHCADQIAEITGWGRLVVGSVLLAAATSMPELTVDVTAVRLGMANLAAGDLFGSSLMNLLILAVLDLSYHSRGKMFSRAAAAHALSGTMSIALTALVGVALLTAARLPDYSLFSISLPSWVILVAYGLGVRTVFLDQRISARAAADQLAESRAKAEREGNEGTHPSPQARRSIWPSAAGFAAMTVVLIVAGPRLADTAGRFADLSGLGKTFVGTTLVALSTSLPELVASLAALRMKAFDLVIGNVFGSNTFNMILFVVLDGVHAGPLFPALSQAHVLSCLAAVVATSIVVMGQLYHAESRGRFFEPDASLVIVVIVATLGLVYAAG